jgi:hypothetical protein
VRVSSLVLGAAFVTLYGSLAQAQPVAEESVLQTPGTAVQTDAQWLATRILSDTARDAQTGFLACVSEAILRNPQSGLEGQERTHPGLTDYVVSDIVGHLRTGFAPKWVEAQTALGMQLAQYPASEQTAVRGFFESPTGIKFLGALDAQLAAPPPPFDRARGMDQCRRTPPTVASFEAEMTDEDRHRFAQFPAEPGVHLTPGSAMQVAATAGGQAATAYFADFGQTAGPMINRASADFAAAHRHNGAH